VAETAPNPIVGCSLAPEGLATQRERYGRVARDVASIVREDGRVVVELADGYDRSVLEELLAVERECCPFFAFDVDLERGRLAVGVSDEEQRPALDAIAAALGGA
jgi:hypothetical protein